MVPGAGARCRSVRQDDTRGHEICWNPFVGDGEEGCKAALDPSSPVHHPPCTFCRNPSVKPQGLAQVARPAVRAGRGSPGAAPLDPSVNGRGSSRSKDGSAQPETSPKRGGDGYSQSARESPGDLENPGKHLVWF